LLATDTEIHVCPPKPKPHVGPVVDNQLSPLKSILSHLLNHHFPKTQEKCPSTVVELRVLPVEEKETFHKLALKENANVVLQPYQAFLSKTHKSTFDKTQDCIGSIQNKERTSYFNIHFVESSHNWPIYPNAIYLSEIVIRQLNLNLKQRVQVVVQTDDPPNRCDSISFYTFVQV
jgi:hypothetical protein